MNLSNKIYDNTYLPTYTHLLPINNTNNTNQQMCDKIKKYLEIKPEEEIIIKNYNYNQNYWFLTFSSTILVILISIILYNKWNDINY